MRRLWLRARMGVALLVVGTGGAAFGLGFRHALTWVYRHTRGATSMIDALAGLPWWGRLLAPMLGALAAGLVMGLPWRAQGLVRTQPSFGEAMEAVAVGGLAPRFWPTMRKTVAAWFAIVGGGSLGREGPIILFGATWAGGWARRLKTSPMETRQLIAAGAAAGFAAAYNAPLAGALFALEVVIGVLALEAVVVVTLAATLAAVVAQLLGDHEPLYGIRTFAWASAALGWALVIALAATLAVQLFMRGLGRAEALPWLGKTVWRPAAGGLLVGGLLVWQPLLAGNGYEPLRGFMDGHVAMSMVLLLTVGKALATTASVASGSPGGVFTPTMLVGGGAGAVVAQLALAAGLVAPSALPLFVALGMAAGVAAGMHAPLMAAVLLVELTHAWGALVPLLVAASVAAGLSQWLRPTSLYGAELARRGLIIRRTLDGVRVEGHPSDEAGPG